MTTLTWNHIYVSLNILCIFLEYYWQEICGCCMCRTNTAVKSQLRFMITLHIPINSKELYLLILGTNFVFWKLHKNQIFALIFDSSIGSVFILFKLVPVTISKHNKKYSVALWRIVQWKVRKADQTYFRLITESIDDFTFCQLQNWTSYSLSPTCLKHISRQMV